MTTKRFAMAVRLKNEKRDFYIKNHANVWPEILEELKKGDHIKILDNKQKEFARGLSSFSSDEINKIIGCHSNEIQNILGYVSKSEVVHKDDMVKI